MLHSRVHRSVVMKPENSRQRAALPECTDEGIEAGWRESPQSSTRTTTAHQDTRFLLVYYTPLAPPYLKYLTGGCEIQNSDEALPRDSARGSDDPARPNRTPGGRGMAPNPWGEGVGITPVPPGPASMHGQGTRLSAIDQDILNAALLTDQ
jgi:hypothetical protein